jgi:hypothetical protein
MSRRARAAAGTFIVLVLTFLPSGGSAQSRVVITVKELTAANHRIEVTTGTEVVWEPHFERIWFPSTDGLVVRRTADGWAVVFDRSGQYRGRFTLVATHGGAGEVYPLTVIVTTK